MSTMKKCKVVMLPTNEKSAGKLWLASDNNKLWFDNHGKVSYRFNSQHLYILSDDEIKEGDWCLDTLHNHIFQFGVSRGSSSSNKKIITTTDNLETSDEVFHNTFKQKLPSPSQSFIEKYVEEYNKGSVITEVMVEYEKVFGVHTPDFSDELKVNPKDNTITIEKVKDSWTREEVSRLVNSAINDYIKHLITRDGVFLPHDSFSTDEWIEENL